MTYDGTDADDDGVVEADVDNESVTTESANGRVQVAPGDDLQSKIDTAGVEGTLEWAVGTYSVGTGLAPKNGQTWHVPSGATFQPTANIPMLDLVDVDDFLLHGNMHISDPNGNTSTTPAVLFNNSTSNNLQSIEIDQYFRGVQLNGSSGGVNENWIGYLYVDAVDDKGLVFENEAHDNTVTRAFIKDCGGDALFFNTNGVDGGNYIGSITGLNCVVGANLDSFQELWIGTAILDANSASGLSISEAGEGRLWINQLWTATNGNNGVDIVPGAGNTVEDIQIGVAYSYNNTNFGWLINAGAIEGLYVGSLITHNNDTGATGTANLRVNGSVERSVIGMLRSYGGPGVDGGGSITDGHILRAIIEDSQNLSAWTTVNGGPRTTYSLSNVTTDRTFDADSTTTDEIADVLGTLLNDLQSAGMIQ